MILSNTDIQNSNNSPFVSTLGMEVRSEWKQKVELLDLFVTTEYPRYTQNDLPHTAYAFQYFDDVRVSFSNNQDSLLISANDLFKDTLPLGNYEQDILNKTFQKSLKSKPTRPNRY